MPRKTGQEARAERLTWFALCLVFIVLTFDEQQMLPGYVIPFLVATILIVSGIFQYTRKWRVSPVVWGAAGILIAFGIYGLVDTLGIYGFTAPFPIDLRLISLVAVIAIIIFGIVTNEG